MEKCAMLEKQDTSLNKTRPEELTSWQKVAVLLVALGEEVSGDLMRSLDDQDVGRAVQAIAELKSIPTALQDEILLEFEQALRQGGGGLAGGMEFARHLLEEALGAERAGEVLARMSQPTTTGFAMLKRMDPALVAPFFRNEHPQKVALILSQLEAQQAAGILQLLPESVQSDVAQRIATLEHIVPEILDDVDAGLVAMLHGVSQGDHEAGGVEATADILNMSGTSMERAILNRLDEQDPELAEEIRNHMLVFDNLVRLDDAGVRALLGQLETPDLMLALKAADKAVRDKFLSNMSERRRTALLEDMEVMPRVRLSEAEEAQTRIVQIVRQLEEQGVLRLPKPGVDDPMI
jgi:flagellar motor switch protein FliG